MPRKSNARETWPTTFLAEYLKTGNLSHSARVAGVDRKTVQRRREKNAAFAEAMEDAELSLADDLEMEARRRAYDGIDEPVFYKGEECGTTRRHSDPLIIFLMKANNPKKYGGIAGSKNEGGVRLPATGSMRITEVVVEMPQDGDEGDDATLSVAD